MRTKRVLIGAIIVVLMIGGVVVLFASWRNREFSILFTQECPHRNFVVEIRYKPAPLNSPHLIRLYVNETLLSEFDFYSRGSSLGHNNYTFYWTNEGANVGLTGVNGQELLYSIDFTNEAKVSVSLIEFSWLDNRGILDRAPPVLWFSQTNSHINLNISVEFIEPFKGPHKIYVRANNDILFETWISNDTLRLSADNYDFQWSENGALLSFFGRDQREEDFVIEVVNENVIFSSANDSKLH